MSEEESPSPAANTSAEAPESLASLESNAEMAATPDPALYPRKNPKHRGTSFEDNSTALHATAKVAYVYDDNILLSRSTSDKRSDQTLTFGPGLSYAFGQNSLTHGSIAYEMDFVHYTKHSAPNTRLGHGMADFGYADDRLKLNAGAAYNQSYQNTRNIVTVSGRSLFETDLLGLDGSAEASLTPNTSIGTGIDYSRTSYHSPGLVGSKATSIPINVYYKTTPKVDLSLGVNFRNDKPDAGGSQGKDVYYNIGARGSFTPKLSGNFSVGYRNRTGDNGLKESLLGFNGSFDYELTPKSAMTVGINRDFSTGSLGESVKSAGYSLKLSTTFSPQWEASVNLSYQQANYGPTLYSTNPVALTTVVRKDNFWEGGLAASYLYTSWLTATAGFTHSNNGSSINGLSFADNLFSLTMNLRY